MRILYLDLDTLRPDHLGCYGYHRNTSPNIDRIAREGVRLEQCYCSDAPCLPSRTALMTGQFGFHTGVVNHGGECADPWPQGANRNFRDRLAQGSLPGRLNAAGLHTCYIGGFGYRHSAWSFYAGFREIHDTGMGGMESAEHVSPAAEKWLTENAGKDNWYLQVNYWDPHTPYRAPAGFGNPFASEPGPAWITPEVLGKHRAMPGPHTAQDIAMWNSATDPRYPRHPGELRNLAEVKAIHDGYDCGIRYMDEHIGRLLAILERQGVLKDTAIIVSSDHGENMGELGIYAEHATADAATCRIPMIIRWPGARQGAVDPGLHYNLDLGPTLVDLLEGEKSPKPTHWEGRSFAGSVTSAAETGRSHLVISQCAHVCQRGVRWDKWLYMRTWHDGFHLFPTEMLFDLASDPHEQHDLASKLPEVREQGAKLLADWTREMLRTMPPGHASDPMEIVLAEGGPFHAKGNLPQYLKRLEATGRGQHVAALKSRHPQEQA